ncbi:hypothetical protein [Sphingomonas prati]|uniref:Uncharacterized protein n=1 Tax=Sphingomonas prati TaxID=1843237 RepID=A0A7W9BS31_9SPHN|nr:hypothetical protein [Sphingomonas prati]MBB5728995.1 hypothetical protein [Sphingomonas prati]GGE85878.1 hypothetical protein GCM10011404_18370 [Sphingomonas prati]
MIKQMTGLCAVALIAMPAVAATPRDILTNAAFNARDKATALAQVAQAEAGANATLARTPGDREAQLTKAMAIGYRAKLTKSRADAVAARDRFNALAAANPRDPEAQAVVAGWNIDAVTTLGGFIASTALGAKKATGLAALDRSVALAGNRAMFPGLAALLRLTLDGADPKARGLAEAATRGATPTALDRVIQRSATAILVPVRAGNAKAAQAMAKQLLPFGRVAK